jgi:alpha-beta hydrolase superfamily lysophospholipase
MTEQTFEGKGGVTLFARSWPPAEGTARGVVVIVHGFKSHSGLYEWVAEEFVKRNLAVQAFDLRGHGKSGGERFYVDKFADYVADLGTFMAASKARDPGLPTFLLGHSAGGVVACTYALDHQREIDGLISESFAYEVPAPDVALALLKGLSHLAPHAHILSLKDEYFSRDPAFVAAMKSDPLIVHTAGAIQTLAEVIRADERLRKELPRITLPLLILHGTGDKATKATGSQHFYERAGSQDKTLKLYPGHYHDLLNDIDKEIVMADIIEWITTRIRKPS